jgi:peptide/nickel transport system permease protein
MTNPALVGVIREDGPSPHERSKPSMASAGRRLVHLLPRRLSARIGLVVIIAFIVVAIFGPELAPYSPLTQNITETFRPPLSTAAGQFHLLGTDDLGRDVLSRIIVGSRPILEVIALASALAGAFGFIYGLAAAFAPRFIEELLLRIADIQLSIPPFILAILLAVLIGSGIKSSSIAIAVVTWPAYARLIRTEAAKLRNSQFVLSARVSGLSWSRILVRHVARNVLSVFVVLMTFNIGVTIIFESSLSFIGYGIQPPAPDWGNILADGVQNLNYWWLATMPGIAIMVLVLASNAVGEDIRARVVRI